MNKPSASICVHLFPPNNKNIKIQKQSLSKNKTVSIFVKVLDKHVSKVKSCRLNDVARIEKTSLHTQTHTHTQTPRQTIILETFLCCLISGICHHNNNINFWYIVKQSVSVYL